MTILFFDTETTGLPPRRGTLASDVECWPRIVEIAWTLADARGREKRSRSLVVRPDGFSIPRDATRIHGITTKMALETGVALASALEAFEKDLAGADLVVAHNLAFDGGVVGAEFHRAGRRESPLDGVEGHCTMEASTDLCRLPGKWGGYKWPRLEELHRFLFGAGVENAHDALADVRACARCFFDLRRRGIAV